MIQKYCIAFRYLDNEKVGRYVIAVSLVTVAASSALMVLPIRATELLAGRKVGGSPLSAAVLDEKKRFLTVHVALHRAADNGARSREVLENLPIN